MCNKMHTVTFLYLFPCLFFTLVAAQQSPHAGGQLDGRATPEVPGNGIEDNRMTPLDSFLPAFFLEAQRLDKNVTISSIEDQSLELIGRQTCNVGYGYCAAAGGCCLDYRKCCSYGYCIDVGDACCPGSACPAGSTCCGVSTCHPIGTQCCSDGNYCSQGNICVIYDGLHVCCTDLSCTAHVVSGITTYATTQTRATTPPPTITPPPTTTRVIVNQYKTWYYTLTWWYLSYYWTTFRAESTVTYTTIYSTTTYTTEAVDRDDASSRFAILSSSLTFVAPASATSLKSLFSAPVTFVAPASATSLRSSFSAPVSDSPTFTARLDSTEGLVQNPSTRTISSPTSVRTTVGSTSPAGSFVPSSKASALFAGRGLYACTVLGSALLFLL